MPRLHHILLLLLLLLTAGITPAAPSTTAKPPQPATAKADTKRYWITDSTGKTHNRNCRYYQNSKGHHSATGTGIDCKICGGATRG